MIRRLWRRWGRWIAWSAACLAVPVAILLAVVAVDVLRAPGEITTDDTRFQTAPMRQRGLWDVGFLPGDLSEPLLGLEDDVTYRKLVGLYLRVEPGKVDYSGYPELESLRAKAQFELTRMSREDPDLERRSRLLTLYGVMLLDFRGVSDEERESILQRAVSAFSNAIELDASNEDAKTNLETALRVFGPVAIPGSSPTGGREGGSISGQGNSGSGY